MESRSALLRIVSFLRSRGAEPSQLEAKARTLAASGLYAGTFAGVRVYANEDCPPDVLYVLSREE